MAIRMGLCTALLSATALTACGGGGGSSSSTPPTSGLPAPGDIVGANTLYISTLENYIAILEDPLLDRTFRSELAPPGSAAFVGTGIGRITDQSVNSSDITAASLRRRSVMTDVVATVDFDRREVSATQSNFIDVDGNSVPGSVTWNGTYGTAGTGVFTATVSGDVGGTVFSTTPQQASVVYLSDGSSRAVSGLFVDGQVSSSGWLQGSVITGDFATTPSP
jgi:hypothetical protein